MSGWLARRGGTLKRYWAEGFGDEVFRAAWCAPLLLAIGYGVCLLRPEVGEQIYGYFARTAAASGAMSAEGGALAMTLFENNLAAAVSAMVDGLFPFLYLSAMPLGVNLFFVGAFAAYYQRCGIGLGVYAAGILPHGVLEIPALVIACAAGLTLCRAVTCRLRGREGMAPGAALAGTVHVLWLVVMPLLLAAALLETYVTPLVLGGVMG